MAWRNCSQCSVVRCAEATLLNWCVLSAAACANAGMAAISSSPLLAGTNCPCALVRMAMVPPVKMMWTRFWLMVLVYLLGVTTFFFGSTPLAALLPAVGAVFVLAFGVAVAAGLTAVLLVEVLALVLVAVLAGLVDEVVGFAAGFVAGFAAGVGALVLAPPAS